MPFTRLPHSCRHRNINPVQILFVYPVDQTPYTRHRRLSRIAPRPTHRVEGAALVRMNAEAYSSYPPQALDSEGLLTVAYAHPI